MPIGYNILDFQGRIANQDVKLIENLMTHIPNVYLMIHADNMAYVDNVLKKISRELLFNFRERVIFVQRNKSE